jgi:hypothetical protein
MKRRKKKSLIPLYCLLFPVFFGCGNGKEAAFDRISKAQTFYERNEIAAAKNELDTIRLLYSEDPEIMKSTLKLTWMVELKQADRNIAYCDSILPILQNEVDRLKKNFILDKDEKYQDIGNYILRSQSIEKNVERNYIRCGVSEKGEIYLASVFFGAAHINHTGLTLSLSSGISASTATIPYDGGLNYRFKDMGNAYEIVNYKGDNAIDAIKLIYANPKERIKATYTGGKQFSLYIDNSFKQDVVQTYQFAAVLSDFEQISREREIAIKKKAYLEEKLNN